MRIYKKLADIFTLDPQAKHYETILLLTVLQASSNKIELFLFLVIVHRCRRCSKSDNVKLFVWITSQM